MTAKVPFTDTPIGLTKRENVIEAFRVELNELRQEFETFKFEIQDMLVSSFNKIINKVDEMKKNGK